MKERVVLVLYQSMFEKLDILSIIKLYRIEYDKKKQKITGYT